MKSTTVVNKYHKVPFDVYIGRGSPWGNPYPIGEDSRETVIRKYEEYLRANRKLLERLEELQGRSLGCYCAPAPCHGDILAAFVDSIVKTGAIPDYSISDELFPKRPKLVFDN